MPRHPTNPASLISIPLCVCEQPLRFSGSNRRRGGGETIRSEISCKYDRAAVQVLFEAAGLELEEWHTDEHQRFALVLGRVRVD